MQQAAVESVSVWNIIVLLLIPGYAVAFWVLWRAIGGVETRATAAVEAQTSAQSEISRTMQNNQRDENARLWNELNGLRNQHSAFQVEAERRYINNQAMTDFKKEIFTRFDRLERHIDTLIAGDKQD